MGTCPGSLVAVHDPLCVMGKNTAIRLLRSTLGEAYKSRNEGRHMKRIFATAATVVVLALGFGVPAHASQPTGGCPDGYEPARALKPVDPVDKNGDGWVCEKPIPSAVPNPGGGGENLVIDNVLKK